jgi:hypothetical protein
VKGCCQIPKGYLLMMTMKKAVMICLHKRMAGIAHLPATCECSDQGEPVHDDA